MSTPRHVYAGSLTDLRGLPVTGRDRCPCPGCPVDLQHVRASSPTPAPHHSDSCSP